MSELLKGNGLLLGEDDDTVRVTDYWGGGGISVCVCVSMCTCVCARIPVSQ